jgi:hypothetical protein
MAVSITKPQVGADADSWGTKLNTALDALVDGHNGTTGTTPNLEAGWKVNGTAVTASAGEINKLDGLTATTDELNKMDGVTVNATKINYLSDVTSNIQAQINAAAGSGGTTYYAGTGISISGTTIRCTVDSAAEVGLSNFTQSAGNYTLCSANSFICTGDITAFYSSDINLKENIQVIPNALEKISAIRGVSYDWKDHVLTAKRDAPLYLNPKHDIGVIAQEVEAVIPEIVAERQDGTKGVRYERLIALLIEGIKELKAELEVLKDGPTE